MKTTKSILRITLCAAGALALATPLAVNATPALPSQQQLAPDKDTDTVRGMVKAKTETTLQVNDKVISTTASTTFTKDGKPITMADIQVGDKVKVTATKGANGTLEAVSIEVTS